MNATPSVPPPPDRAPRPARPTPGRSTARPTRRPVRHVAARSRVGVAVGSIAACVALTGSLALQHIGASKTASSRLPATTAGRGGERDDGGFGDDNGFATGPSAIPAGATGFGQAPAPASGQLGGGANTVSQGS